MSVTSLLTTAATNSKITSVAKITEKKENDGIVSIIMQKNLFYQSTRKHFFLFCVFITILPHFYFQVDYKAASLIMKAKTPSDLQIKLGKENLII